METTIDKLLREIHEESQRQGISLTSMGIESDSDLIEKALRFFKINLDSVLDSELEDEIEFLEDEE